MFLLRIKELNLVRLVSIFVTVLYKLNIKTVIYKSYLFPLIWQRETCHVHYAFQCQPTKKITTAVGIINFPGETTL